MIHYSSKAGIMKLYDFNHHRPGFFKQAIRSFRTVWHPDRFHGHHLKEQFFEGWYFKLISADGKQKWAIIPGVSLTKDGHDDHAFIQVMNGNTGETYYERFNIQDVRYKIDSFYIEIGESTFSEKQIQLNLKDSIQLEGALSFKSCFKWPSSFFSPGIMGPYSFIPTMECNHGVLSMNHQLWGALKINGEPIPFNDGKGYIEKDWGTSFPKAWIWMQSNHFKETQASLCASTAIIPWKKAAFTGYIAGLVVKDKHYSFTTYNGTKLKLGGIGDQSLSMQYKNKNYTMTLIVQRAEGGTLASPVFGVMEGRIKETMKSIILVTLSNTKTHEVLFKDQGEHAGLEVAGEIDQLRRSLPS